METSSGPTGTGGPKHMVYVIHDVANYDEWKKHFDADESRRQQYGLNVISVMRDLENENRIHIAMAAADLERARAFANGEDLRNVMQQAGVTGAPKVYFLNITESDLHPTEHPERMIVIHKVRDYDHWRPFFDQDKVNREKFSLEDRMLTREDGNENNLGLSFTINDIGKAKEFAANDDLKQVMQQAGVEGPPEIYFTRIVS